MSKIFISALLSIVISSSLAQTATNFNCNDCSGESHDLFTELDSGKIIVLCWVMPCGSCVGPSKTTYNVVQSFQTTNPDKVYFYLCDDLANTSCSSLSSWATTNKLTNAVKFSNPAIKMSDYGSSGMPKIVVIAGTGHKVYYNLNNSVNAGSLKDSINSALAPTSIIEKNIRNSGLQIFPNPANNSTVISFHLFKSSEVKVDLYNMEGKLMASLFSGMIPQGENEIKLNLTAYNEGIYLVKVTEDTKTGWSKIIVSH